MREELAMKLDGLRQDAGAFFSMPIPKSVWEKLKTVRDQDVASVVENCRRREQWLLALARDLSVRSEVAHIAPSCL